MKVTVEASKEQLMREWTSAKWSAAKCSAMTKWEKKKPMPPTLTERGSGDVDVEGARVGEGEEHARGSEDGEAQETGGLGALSVEEGSPRHAAERYGGGARGVHRGEAQDLGVATGLALRAEFIIHTLATEREGSARSNRT